MNTPRNRRFDDEEQTTSVSIYFVSTPEAIESSFDEATRRDLHEVSVENAAVREIRPGDYSLG